MKIRDILYWRRHPAPVERMQRAIDQVVAILAPNEARLHALQDVLMQELEPALGVPAPFVDPSEVDLDALLGALDTFWAAYRDLPSAPSCSSGYEKYRYLPEPLPQLQRGMLDQCLRVLLHRAPHAETVTERRLYRCVIGDVTEAPQMQGWFKRYPTVVLPGSLYTHRP